MSRRKSSSMVANVFTTSRNRMKTNL